MKYLKILIIIVTFTLISKIYSEKREGRIEQNTAIKNSKNVPSFRLGNNPMLQYKMDRLGRLHYSILQEEIKKREELGRQLNMKEQENISKELKVKFKPLLVKGEMMSSQNHVLTLSSALTRYASSLTKIANDIRWMNSGPISGLSEISLKPLQPGSSIMPGKINPVISESILMAAAHVNGNHVTIMQASSSGSFQLNTMLPVIAHNIIESLYLMINCTFSMIELIDSFSINEEKVKDNLFRNPIIATKLNQVIGYDLASKIVKEAYKTNSSIFDIAEKMTSLTKSELIKILDPKKLI